MLKLDANPFQRKKIHGSINSYINNTQNTAGHNLNEANNNIVTMNTTENIYSTKGLRGNFNELQLQDEQLEPDWNPEQMSWSGDTDTLAMMAANSASMMSFESNCSASASFHSQLSEHAPDFKEEEVLALMNKAKSCHRIEASQLLLTMSESAENCLFMRHCGCLPLLVRLIHGGADDEEKDVSSGHRYQVSQSRTVEAEVRERAELALRNVILEQPDDKRSRREARVLKLLEQVRNHSNQLGNAENDNRKGRSTDQQLAPSVAALMKLSFDEDHRYAMCQLGGLEAVAELLETEQVCHGCSSETSCVAIRRYAGMVLTNLTFGDGANKAQLCALRPFMEALVAQLYSQSEDLRQVTASVLRNLSWRADPASKRSLREVGAVSALMRAAMQAEKESTLKSILSALWNLSAHCSANKADICREEGALAFIVSSLTYRSKSRTLAVVENGGGILRNVSSHVALQNEYRAILRQHNCLQTLLRHLQSPSLTVVSNACGALWNLSARNAQDQRTLWELGAVAMLKKLIHSKHKMISMGSSAALKNLLNAGPPGVSTGLCLHPEGLTNVDGGAPSLLVRKQRALSTELDPNLSETCDNTDSPKTSPVKQRVRRHVSPSAAKYLANQKLKSELSLLPTYVVQEKHNGAFQVTKNAKQAQNYRQGQAKFLTDHTTTPPEQQNSKQTFSNKPGDRSSRSMSPVGVRKEPHKVQPTNSARIKEPPQKVIIQQKETQPIPPPTESRIPLPKSSRQLDIQRSQSASPVGQRRQQKKEAVQSRQIIPPNNLAEPDHLVQKISTNTQKIDVSVTHPKQAWSSISLEKQDSEVNFSKRLGKDANPPAPAKTDKLFVSSRLSYTEEESKPCYPEETQSPAPRCSLDIRTSTGVRMVRNHPLLANREQQTRDQNEGSGRTMEFCVQGDYEMEDLSLTSRSNSAESLNFASDDMSHHSDSDCETAQTSPLRSTSQYVTVTSDQLRSSRTIDTFQTACLDDVPTENCLSMQNLNGFLDDEEEVTLTSESKKRQKTEDGADITSYVTAEDSELDLPDPNTFDVELSHISRCSMSSEEMPLDECIKTGQMLCKDTLVVKEADYESHSENEEKGKEDERKAEKNKLFRIPESPDDKKVVFAKCMKKNDSLLDRPELSVVVQPRPTVEVSDESQVSIEERPKSVTDVQQSSGNKLSSTNERQILVVGKVKNIAVVRPSFPAKLPSQDDGPELSAIKTKTENVESNVNDSLKRKPSKGNQIISYVECNGQSNLKKTVSPVQAEFKENLDRNTVVADLSGNRRPEKKLNKPEKEILVPSQLEFLITKPGKKTDAPCTKNVKTNIVNKVANLAISKTVTNSVHLTDEILTSAQSSQYTSINVTTSTSQEDISEKEMDCSESQGNDESMVASAILNEAKEIADALLCARTDSTEDMTVSTLSCLSDIDNARPPSVMADLGCLSMTNSTASEENFKAAVTRECQKLFGKNSKQKSLLRELQVGRMQSDNSYNENSKASNDNISVKSNTTELLGNVNPPSYMDDMSMTSLEGSDSECEPEHHLVGRFASNQDSISERMHDARGFANLYAKELSNIRGDYDPVENEATDVCDVTEVGGDTIGSDTEFDDELPDDEMASETVHQNLLKEDSIDNIIMTDDDCYSGFFMTNDEFLALKENADMILNTLKDVEVSEDEEENCGNSSGDLLDDETMSLVSNESDEDLNSPEGPYPQTTMVSPSCNGMVALPQIRTGINNFRSQMPLRKGFSGLPKCKKYSYQEFDASREPEDHNTPRHQRGETLVLSRRMSADVQPTLTKPKVQLKSPTSALPPTQKVMESKIGGVWKKARSKSAADINRNCNIKVVPSEPTCQRMDDEESSPVRRPNSLHLLQKTSSPRHTRGLVPRPQQTNDNTMKSAATVTQVAITSPISHVSSANIPKANTSFIPSRRSMIPTPAKFGQSEN